MVSPERAATPLSNGVFCYTEPMFSKSYEHNKYEKDIYQKWEDSGAFEPSKTGKPYTILMPPPNANASLHSGHAMYTIDDILIRWKRMQGFSALWAPGLDHAGFETQYVYEKNLAKEGKSRMDFDRQTLYDNVYKFVKDNSGLIVEQFRQLGFSADWKRSVFTLDDHVLKQVFETFKKMEGDNKVYRSEYIVNFCVHCGTSLAELEVEHEERVDPLYYVRYPLLDDQTKYVIVATTRPEPIWADTHLAVNPKDKKNKHLIGQKVLNPLTGAEMEIIGDEFVEPEFGTGIVKLTPAHDQTDFGVAKKHGLPIRLAIDLRGKMVLEAGKYAGMKVKEARETVLTDLKEKGLIEKVDEKYLHSVNLCYKCKRVLEPMVTPNWFIKVEDLKKPVIDVVKKDRVKFYPNRFKKQMLDWLKIMHDWPISRQVAWGIRIPVWYSLKDNSTLQVTYLKANGEQVLRSGEGVLSEGELLEARLGLQRLQAPIGCKYVISETCPGDDYLQETDTFDTWFSSGQWPLVTLKGDEFATRYPTDVMATLADILKFWVSRMIMFGLYIKNEIPFKDVYLWSMVADAKGVKMSKSKGNVINPIEYVNKYGADALRMTMVYGVAPGGSVPLSEDKVRGMRNFANKIWNVARFSQTIETGTQEDTEWVSELNTVVSSVTGHMEKYRFGQAAEELYEFVWHRVADVYIEDIKSKKISGGSLKMVLHTCLKLLHPFMPFVTEAVWSELGEKEMLITTEWPTV